MTLKFRIKTVRARRAGFSLAEFAIVLGIMGVVLSALWSVVSIVRENIKREEMAQQMVLMVSNIREFYANRIRVADAAGNTTAASLTDYLLRQSVLLPEQIRNRSAGVLVADTPWGAAGASGALLANGGIAVDGQIDSSQVFRIELRGLKYSSCVALADKLTGSNMPLGLVSMSVNGGTAHVAFPVASDDVSDECALHPGASDNIMDFVYRLRKQETT